MWTNQEFIDKYLARIGKKNAWEDSIFPAFKNSILCAMLSIQDLVENRKNSFELYGADFMITEDLKPWLIEINCSPTMARSTEITTMLCDNVLDDICKGNERLFTFFLNNYIFKLFQVVIDRKINKNADIGRFELMHKAVPVQVPTYIGIDLKVDGHAYNNRSNYNNNSNSNKESKQSPRQTNGKIKKN
jgi:tubulin monoglycylase TTLL3/8